MIYVCDAIMGSGKSSAIINYMNDHPDGRYVYITPYLEEARRIRENCPALNFVEPRDDIEECGKTKVGHTMMLINQCQNVTSTHQALKGYGKALLNHITEMEYTLVIDENIDMLGKRSMKKDDLKILIDYGLVSNDNNRLRRTDREYKGDAFRDTLQNIVKTETYTYSDSDNAFWLLSPELISAFKDVYILTYLFEGQGIYHFIRINKMEFVKIGVRTNNGRHEFCDYPGELPEYTKHLKEMIHICMDDKLNEIGKKKTALSATKFKNGDVDMDRLRLNLRTFFRKINKDKPAKERMWAVFKGSDIGKKRDYVKEISDKGYTNCFTQYNARATNKYRDKTVLAYLVNVYMNLPDKHFYISRGINVDEEMYALSVMVQWIWRSAIRDGKEIYIYIPSRRMREMLIKWIDSFDTGGGLDEA